MKTLFFMNELRQGAGMINREVGFAKELVTKGFEVSILSYFRPSWSIDVPKINVETCLPVKYYHFLYENLFLYPFLSLIIMFKFFKLKPDVVMVDLHQEAFWAILFRPIFKYKVVFTYHGVADSKFFPNDQAKELNRIREKSYKYLKESDQVIVVSQFLVEELKKEGIESTKVFNGVDIQHFNPTKKIHSTKTVNPQLLFVGRYSEYKGALNIVKAFALVKEKVPDAELIMHAFHDSKEYLNEIYRVIQDHSLQDSCHIFGPLSFAEVPYRINSCTLFINGSLDETFAMPLLEAQACGIPCVAFKAGGVPEVVKNNETGILVDEGSVEEFANAIVSLIENPKLRSCYSKGATEHAKTYQYSILTEELINVLKCLEKEKERIAKI